METNDPKLKQAPAESDLQKDKAKVVETPILNRKVEEPAIDRETVQEIDKKFGHLKES